MLSRQSRVGTEEPVRWDGNRIEPEVPEIWRPAGCEWIELHRGRKVTQSYPRHWHDELYVAAILGGTGNVEYSGGAYATPVGSFVVVPAGEIHANTKDECAFRCMFIECKGLQTAVEQFRERSISVIDFRSSFVRDPQTLAEFLELHLLLETQSSQLGRETSVSRFLHHLVERHSEASASSFPGGRDEHAAVRRAREFLEEHYADRVSLRDLSRLTGLSPFHLHRSFSRRIGMPPHAYQVHVRISRARSFLRGGRAISDIASSTGFADQSHFTYAFKRLMGVTPGQYARARNYNTSPPAGL